MKHPGIHSHSFVRIILPMIASVAASPLFAAQSPAESIDPIGRSTAALALTNVTVVDVTDGRLFSDQTVVITGHRVQAVGPSGQVRVPKGAQVVEARGKYLIPGLWNMHVHMWKTFDDYPKFIAHGVTGVRDMGQMFPGGADSFRVWQREIMAGMRVGPRAIGPSVDLTQTKRLFKIATAADARRIIDSLKATGIAFLKFHDHWADRDLYFAMLREARRVGLPFIGHVPAAVTETEAADSGHVNIEHVNEHATCWPALAKIDSAAIERSCAAAAQAYIRNGTWLTPSLVVHHLGGTAQGPPGVMVVVEARADSQAPEFVRVMHRFGVRKFLAGSDYTANKFSLLQELVLLVRAGLSPLESLQAATLNPAMFLNGTDSLGTVAPGKLADLILLDADPLEDIHNVLKIRAVVANGRYFDRGALDVLDPQGVKRAETVNGQFLRSGQLRP